MIASLKAVFWGYRVLVGVVGEGYCKIPPYSFKKMRFT
ncbi:hypothetical protein HPHPP11_0122 [Helicobacter pylori Hp P-11]|nr:hypothetical protein HPHPP11_0122 [Helicobacter pylori Hp P-11]